MFDTVLVSENTILKENEKVIIEAYENSIEQIEKKAKFEKEVIIQKEPVVKASEKPVECQYNFTKKEIVVYSKHNNLEFKNCLIDNLGLKFKSKVSAIFEVWNEEDTEKLEFEQMKRDLAQFKRFISIQEGRIVFEMPIIVRGTATINGITIYAGYGNPESVIPANVGSIYLRLNGSGSNTLYVKESGNGTTGWSTTA